VNSVSITPARLAKYRENPLMTPWDSNMGKNWQSGFQIGKSDSENGWEQHLCGFPTNSI